MIKLLPGYWPKEDMPEGPDRPGGGVAISTQNRRTASRPFLRSRSSLWLQGPWYCLARDLTQVLVAPRGYLLPLFLEGLPLLWPKSHF